MIKLFKVKEKQKELAENANGKGHVKKQSAGELRLHKVPLGANQDVHGHSVDQIFESRAQTRMIEHVKHVNTT